MAILSKHRARMSTIAAIGNLSLDRVSDAPARPGGTVFYSAGTLARLGVVASIAVACAEADRTRLVPPLEELGLPVTWYPGEATTAYSFHYEGERRVMLQEAVGDPWGHKQSLEAVGDASWVHVGALVRTDFAAETLAALAAGERRLLVDAQGLVRTAALGPLRTDGEIGDILRHVAILNVNEEEAKTLVGGVDAHRLRSLGVSEVLLTLGSRGALLVTEHKAERIPAIEIAVRVDPTGAGDTFSAAYLAARAAGAEPAEAARSATANVASFLSSR